MTLGVHGADAKEIVVLGKFGGLVAQFLARINHMLPARRGGVAPHDFVGRGPLGAASVRRRLPSDDRRVLAALRAVLRVLRWRGGRSQVGQRERVDTRYIGDVLKVHKLDEDRKSVV